MNSAGSEAHGNAKTMSRSENIGEDFDVGVDRPKHSNAVGIRGRGVG